MGIDIAAVVLIASLPHIRDSILRFLLVLVMIHI